METAAAVKEEVDKKQGLDYFKLASSGDLEKIKKMGAVSDENLKIIITAAIINGHVNILEWVYQSCDAVKAKKYLQECLDEFAKNQYCCSPQLLNYYKECFPHRFAVFNARDALESKKSKYIHATLKPTIVQFYFKNNLFLTGEFKSKTHCLMYFAGEVSSDSYENFRFMIEETGANIILFDDNQKFIDSALFAVCKLNHAPYGMLFKLKIDKMLLSLEHGAYLDRPKNSLFGVDYEKLSKKIEDELTELRYTVNHKTETIEAYKSGLDNGYGFKEFLGIITKEEKDFYSKATASVNEGFKIYHMHQDQNLTILKIIKSAERLIDIAKLAPSTLQEKELEEASQLIKILRKGVNGRFNSDNQTALQYALRRGHCSLIELLMNAGANLDLQYLHEGGVVSVGTNEQRAPFSTFALKYHKLRLQLLVFNKHWFEIDFVRIQRVQMVETYENTGVVLRSLKQNVTVVHQRLEPIYNLALDSSLEPMMPIISDCRALVLKMETEMKTVQEGIETIYAKFDRKDYEKLKQSLSDNTNLTIKRIQAIIFSYISKSASWSEPEDGTSTHPRGADPAAPAASAVAGAVGLANPAGVSTARKRK